MSARPWMPLYVADYLADTGHLSTTEHGSYMLLIMHYWMNNGLPTEDLKLARICRLSPPEWQEIKETISDLFDAGWRHKRIDAEMAKADETISKRKAAGVAGASARYGKGNGNRTEEAKQTDRPLPSQPDTTTSVVVGAPKDVSRETEKRATRLPEDFVPSVEVAMAEGLKHADAVREGLKFKDWALSAPGDKGLKRDWMAAWRNWCRRAAEDKGLLPAAAVIDVQTIWLDREDPRWAWAANKYEVEKGRKPIAAGSRNHSGQGFEFPPNCIPPVPKRKDEQEAA